ncbi:hypothetical protein, variant [Allomyces macrogynus ATCC 38327]|uniref:EF-hand domain-containing protein n=1 Tax=Allomyces macrogynus (strain ATCC 38327) TaxID=578462 RepID=A0A0L0SNN7_ALLM3|nr:hypothetical protein, variant [Allomyces macrogynus ATCC 38327]|eukprot:KNE63979.1 hypothetical protein, variant [Allomyces macrogynus ATCC 38327]
MRRFTRISRHGRPAISFWSDCLMRLMRTATRRLISESLCTGCRCFRAAHPRRSSSLDVVSFRIYDINGDGFIERKELFKIMSQMYSAFYNEDQSARIHELVARFFEDLDVNGDGQLSLTEYKLQAMKEPLIVDFLQQFLADPDPRTGSLHNLSIGG